LQVDLFDIHFDATINVTISNL